MTTTMNLIAKQTVGAGGATSVTFSNIPQTFTDLKLVISARDSRTGITVSDVWFNFNNTGTGTGISGKILLGQGSSASSQAVSANGELAFMSAAANTANTFGNAEVYIPNYTNSSNYKSISSDSVTETNSTTAYALLTAGLWSNNAPITSITMSPFTSPFTEFSTFYLYGISNSTTTQNRTTPSASGGDVITTDGAYWYHTFKYSGIFKPLKSLTCDYLVVAGGGSSGNAIGANPTVGTGGGGAGGLRSTVTATGGGGNLETPLNLVSNTSYPITVGAGGAGGSGSNGGNSSFSTVTATGGGRGGDFSTSGNAATGGSGGGGGISSSSSNGSGATGTANQGFSGGAGGSSQYGGGGGGAGGAGGSGASGARGTAGAGLSVSISGSSVTYAAGGLGGGQSAGDAPSQPANTGNGGIGGTNNLAANGLGGSGVVIVRYAV